MKGNKYMKERFKVRIPKSFAVLILTTFYDGIHPIEYKDHCVWFRWEGYAQIFKEKGYDVQTY